MRWAVSVFGALWAVAVFGSASTAFDIGETISGSVVQVLDGDTLRIQHARGVVDVRLAGLDAPEWGQLCEDHAGRSFSCGRAATKVMVSILGVEASAERCDSRRAHGVCLPPGQAMIRCAVRDLDRRWGRPVAQCVTGQEDLGAAMVQRGFARAAYGNQYRLLEWRARFRKIGLWAGRFGDPADVRREK